MSIQTSGIDGLVLAIPVVAVGAGVPVPLLIPVSLCVSVLVMSGTVAVETPVFSIAVKNREWSRITSRRGHR
ncbi:hypothetical protein N7536_001666 [Penicillium majusculum]|nr:hypothetical protein N7536_001666 [Penicillium majusculum]